MTTSAQGRRDGKEILDSAWLIPMWLAHSSSCRYCNSLLAREVDLRLYSMLIFTPVKVVWIFDFNSPHLLIHRKDISFTPYNFNCLCFFADSDWLKRITWFIKNHWNLTKRTVSRLPERLWKAKVKWAELNTWFVYSLTTAKPTSLKCQQKTIFSLEMEFHTP